MNLSMRVIWASGIDSPINGVDEEVESAAKTEDL